MSQIDFEFNPLTGSFDIIDKQDHHGGFYHVPEGRTILIEQYKAMFALQNFTLEGTIILNGMIGIIE
jgi:hypothetical protein